MPERRDPFSPAKRSEVMSRIRRRDTKPELALRRELSRRGLRYRLDYAGAPGRPDIAFPGKKIAVFIDGEFWHGKQTSPERLAEMSPYWQRKLRRNMERDRHVNFLLTLRGWTVIRVTDRAVKERIERVGAFVERAHAGENRGYRPPGVEAHRPRRSGARLF